MFPASALKKGVLAVFVLALALAAACGGGDGEAPLPDQIGTAPNHLLIRPPLSVDYPITLDESESLRMAPLIYGPEAMEAGQSYRYAVSVFDCCVVVRPVEGSVVWSVGADELANVDAKTGFLVVDETAPHGSVVNIKAIVKGVEDALTRQLTVFSREQNPLVGRWQEEGIGGIRELLFLSDGRYVATWTLLETWMDLFGDYTVDTATGKIGFIKDWERVETHGFQGQGEFEVDGQGRLLLTGICATEPDPDNPDCIRRFVRSN